MEDLALDDDDLGGAEEKAPIVPAGTKRLRACLVSKLIKTEQQFVDEGCENVPELPMRGERETVLECTTTDFDGMVALMDPAKSWVGKWQGINRLHPGCYALTVRGVLPDEYVARLEDAGINYEPDQE